MADIQLGIKVSVDGNKASASLTNLSSQVAQTGRAARSAGMEAAAYGKAWIDASARMEAASAKMKNASGTFMAAQLSKQIRPMATELAVLEAQTLKTARSFESLAVGWAKFHMLLMGARQTLAMAQGLTETADAAAQLEARLKLVSGSTQEYAQALAAVRQIANTYQQDLSSIGQTYQQLAPAVQKLGMSQKDLGDILAATAAGLKVSGTSAGAASDFMRQFAQALNSSTVQAEEWNSIQDGNLALVNALEKQLPELIAKYGNLKAAINDQAVTNEMLARAVKGARAELEAQAGGMKTVGGALTALNNDWTVFIGQLDKVATASQKLIGIIQEMSNFLKAFSRDIKASFGDGVEAQMAALAKRINEEESVLENMRRIQGATGPLGNFLIDPDDMARREQSVKEMEKALADLRKQTETPDTSAKPFFDGVKRGAAAADEALNGLDKTLKKSGLELVNATAQAFKLNTEQRAVAAQIVSVAEKNGFDPALLLSIAQVESSMNRMAVSTTSTSRGLFQFIKATRERFGVADPFNVEQATIGAIKYMRFLMDMFPQMKAAIAAYNQGEGTIQKNGNQANANGDAYYRKVVANMEKLNNAMGLAGQNWDSYKDRIAAADAAFGNLKLHQDDAAKAAEEYSATQIAKVKTSLTALKAEEEAQQRVTAAELASAKTMDEKQAIIASAAQQSAAFHEAEKSLILAEIALQQKALEAKRAAYVKELSGAQSGQYAQDEAQQLALKQAIRAVDSDLAQLAETRRQAEISAGAAVNEYGQQSLALKAQEAGFIADTIAAYEREVEILNRLTKAKQDGASAEQLGMLRQYYEQGAQLPDVVSAEQLEQVKQYQLSTLAVKEAVDALTKSTEDQKDAEKAVREEQLRQNAFWDQYMSRLQDYNSLWAKVSGNTVAGYGDMLSAGQKYFKNLEQINQAYTEKGKKFDAGSLASDLNDAGKVAGSVAATFGMMGEQFAAMAAQQEKGSVAWKEYNAMAMASVAVAQVAALAQGILAVATAMASDAKLGGFGAIAAGIAVAATLASFGIAMGGAGGGGGGGGTAASRQAEAGTGTVLGDATAKSESISKSLEIIRDNSSNDLNYSAAMLRALENIEAAIKGANNATLLNFRDLAVGLKATKDYASINSNTSVSDWGVNFDPKSLFKIFQDGLDRGMAYVVNSRTGITSSANLDFKGPATQLSRAIRGVADALIEGGKAFGLSASDFNDRLRNFVVDIGAISLKDLSGDDMEKQLSAIMSRLSDQMAMKLMPGLDQFQKAGEGYAETFWRMAEGINRSKGELEQLGMTAIDYTAVERKQGDVAAEIVRQTIEQQGHMSAGVRQYVHELTGSAEDIIDAYKKLQNVSSLMRSAGFGDANINRTMINAAGGLDAFNEAMQSFNDNFLTEAQRFAGASQTLGDQFAALGVAMPSSKDGFYQLLTGIDKTTESGQKLFGALLKLNPEFAKLANQIQGIKDKYADILNPFGKFGAQIKTVGEDFSTLLQDLTSRNNSAVDAFANTTAKKSTEDELAKLRKSRAQKFEQLKADQAEFDKLNAETDPKKRKKNVKRINELRALISEGKDGILALDGFISTDMQVLAGINQSIDAYRQQLETAPAGEKAGILADAGTVMTDTLGKIFSEITATVDAARQKMEAAVTFQKSLQTQIASLQGPDATAALMRSRATEAQRAVDDYWAAMSTGAKRNTDEELRLLGNAQQAIMDKYNAELAAVQQLQQAVEGFNGAIASLKSQIATLQGPGAVAALAGANYDTAFQNLNTFYDAGNSVGTGDQIGGHDYAKELTLIQAAQQAVMDKYNAEMALVQQAAQEQAQALQDNLQTQIDAINAATQAQIDAINTGAEAQIKGINDQLEISIKAQEKANQAEQDTLQTQLDAARKLKDAYQQIAEYAKSMKLGNLTNLSPEAKLAEAQQQYQDLLAKARGGDADAAAKLTGASDAYLEIAKTYYGSGTQYSNIFDGVQAAMQAVGGLNGPDPDSIQSHIDALREQQAAQLDALREAAQTQTDAIRKAANDHIKAVQDAAAAQIKTLQEQVAQQIKDLNDPEKNLAMKALKDAAVADLQRLQALAEAARQGAEKDAKDAALAAEQYKADTLNALKAIAEKAEQTRIEAALQYQQAQDLAKQQFRDAYDLANNQLIKLGVIGGFSQTQTAALNAIAQKLDPGFQVDPPVHAWSIPQYAQGGYAQSGLALVGEKGPELVKFERPAQVMTAQQTREALSGDSPKTFAALEAIKAELKAIVTTQSNANPALIAELRALRERVEKMERNQRLQA